MSQYGAYGLARHGHGYRSILSHYYRHTRVGKASEPPDQVLLGSGAGSVGFSGRARPAASAFTTTTATCSCARGRGVTLRSSGGRKLAGLRPRRDRRGQGHDPDPRQGRLSGQAAWARLGRGPAVTNVVGARRLRDGRGPQRDAGVLVASRRSARRRWRRAPSPSPRRGGGSFDVYDDTRSQVYGGKGSETPIHQPGAAGDTRQQVVRYRQAGRHHLLLRRAPAATPRTVQFAFPGAAPSPT